MSLDQIGPAAANVDRNFAGKAHAFNAGLEQVQIVDFDMLGNLDADVSFEPDYMEFLIRKFLRDPNLGVAGAFTDAEITIKQGQLRRRELRVPGLSTFPIRMFSETLVAMCPIEPGP